MKNAIICDIDGTIADVRHRLHYIQNPDGTKKAKPDWAAFHAACVDDPPFEDVIEIVNNLTYSVPSYRLFILSGRNEVVRTETEKWLEDHVGYTSLTMRRANDRRPDTEVKLDMVLDLGLTPDDVLCIFDDRQCVVDMWRANGYRCLQVAAWKE